MSRRTRLPTTVINLHRLRWLVPLCSFGIGLVVESIHHEVFGPNSPEPFYDFAVYALIGPLLLAILLFVITAHADVQLRTLNDVRAREQFLASIVTASADAIIGL